MKTKPEKINSVQDLIDYLEFVCEQLDLTLHEGHKYILYMYGCKDGLCYLVSIFSATDFLEFMNDYMKSKFNGEYIGGTPIWFGDTYKANIQLRIDWLKENQEKIENSFKKYDTEN